MELPNKFIDLPLHQFPFTIKYLHPETREVLKEVRVEGPGAVEVPAAKDMGVEKVEVEIVWDDGNKTSTV